MKAIFSILLIFGLASADSLYNVKQIRCVICHNGMVSQKLDNLSNKEIVKKLMTIKKEKGKDYPTMYNLIKNLNKKDITNIVNQNYKKQQN